MRLRSLETTVLRIPTDRPEADGTIAWDSTTVVLVEARSSDGGYGLGWTYASAAAATVVHEVLQPAIDALDLSDVRAAWNAMVAAVRNVGRHGIGATAISAVDVALWDLWSRAQGLPLYRALAPSRTSVPIYGSGGFTSYTVDELTEQLGGWAASGIPRVKMKIGTSWGTQIDTDLARITAAREAIGPTAELFIDANGAYSTKQAIRLAHNVEGVTNYFEEPVSSDQLREMHVVRRSISQDVAAGEYAWDPWSFAAIVDAGAVDILQADATRCLGVTGFLIAGDIAYSAGLRFSAHCSPTIHAHVGCAVPQLSHVEYFHDHARIEDMLFEGLPNRVGGDLAPHADRPGLGLELKRRDAERYRAA
ncbi:MAG TPA: enolase C-terminal domain-like protein [Candidatus Dormibacteraeota bacterium]|nr:enolase C-terminal domain-like protein [Candidatus Dormibacteraeota bacterium]